MWSDDFDPYRSSHLCLPQPEFWFLDYLAGISISVKKKKEKEVSEWFLEWWQNINVSEKQDDVCDDV